jgi:hypothetical protein
VVQFTVVYANIKEFLYFTVRLLDFHTTTCFFAFTTTHVTDPDLKDTILGFLYFKKKDLQDT